MLIVDQVGALQERREAYLVVEAEIGALEGRVAMQCTLFSGIGTLSELEAEVAGFFRILPILHLIRLFTLRKLIIIIGNGSGRPLIRHGSVPLPHLHWRHFARFEIVTCFQKSKERVDGHGKFWLVRR